MSLFILKHTLIFGGDGTSHHPMAQEKVAVLYLQLYCKFEISKLLLNHLFKFTYLYKLHHVLSYKTVPLQCVFCFILKMHICSNTIDIFGNSMSITGISHLLCTISLMRNTQKPTPGQTDTHIRTHFCTHLKHLPATSVPQVGVSPTSLSTFTCSDSRHHSLPSSHCFSTAHTLQPFRCLLSQGNFCFFQTKVPYLWFFLTCETVLFSLGCFLKMCRQ